MYEQSRAHMALHAEYPDDAQKLLNVQRQVFRLGDAESLELANQRLLVLIDSQAAFQQVTISEPQRAMPSPEEKLSSALDAQKRAYHWMYRGERPALIQNANEGLLRSLREFSSELDK